VSAIERDLQDALQSAARLSELSASCQFSVSSATLAAEDLGNGGLEVGPPRRFYSGFLELVHGISNWIFTFIESR
jgi:hypothetical protein